MHDIFSYVYLPLLLRLFSIVYMHLDGNTVNFVLGIVLEFSCTNLLLFFVSKARLEVRITPLQSKPVDFSSQPMKSSHWDL